MIICWRDIRYDGLEGNGVDCSSRTVGVGSCMHKVV